jgi:multicomponent Na+:H+ antiporter subunit G
VNGWNVYVIDVLAVLGTASISLAIGWVLRASNPIMKIHAASKAVVTGALLIVVASCLTGQWDVALRALLVGVFLLVTSPISAHALARLALTTRESGRHAHVEPRPARDPLPRASRDSHRP